MTATITDIRQGEIIRLRRRAAEVRKRIDRQLAEMSEPERRFHEHEAHGVCAFTGDALPADCEWSEPA